MDWITFRQRKQDFLKKKFIKSHELKVIVFNNHDFKFAQEQAKVSENCNFIFRANGAKEMKCILRLQILFWNTRNGRASVQTHKYLNIP
jgi:organic radical activating enzyme